MSQLVRLCAVSPEPSLFAHIKYGSRRRVRLNIRHLAPLDYTTVCRASNSMTARPKIFPSELVPEAISLIRLTVICTDSYQCHCSYEPSFLSVHNSVSNLIQMFSIIIHWSRTSIRPNKNYSSFHMTTNSDKTVLLVHYIVQLSNFDESLSDSTLHVSYKQLQNTCSCNFLLNTHQIVTFT